MASSTLTRVLDDMKSLDLEELASIERAIQERHEAEALGYSLGEWKAMKLLVDAGHMKEIRPRLRRTVSDQPAVPYTGKPVSEIIVEERR